MHVTDSPPPRLCHYTLEKNGACRKQCTQSLSRCRLGFGRRWCAEFCCCFVFVFLFCFCFFTFHSDVFNLTEGGLYSHNMQPCSTIYTFTHTFTHLSLKPFFFFSLHTKLCYIHPLQFLMFMTFIYQIQWYHCFIDFESDLNCCGGSVSARFLRRWKSVLLRKENESMHTSLCIPSLHIFLCVESPVKKSCGNLKVSSSFVL